MKLKIGLFNDSFPPVIDGVASCVCNYARVLSQHHADVTVVTPSYPNVTDPYPFPVVRYPSVNLGKRVGYRMGIPYLRRIVKYLREKEFDLIHVHSPFVSSLLASSVTGRSHSIPVVLTYHTKFEIDIKKRAPTLPLQRTMEKAVLHNLKRADEIWAVSNGAAESMRYLGYNGPYAVMENGTDFPRGRAPEEAQAALREKLGLSRDVLTFLFVGRMMWYKNVRLILDALALLHRDGLSFQMIFVGDGNDRADVMAYAESLGILHRTRFPGAVRDRELVRTYFSLADLFLFPSTYDTTGLVVKEAAACACPSMLVRGSCAAEGVTDGRNGFLCAESAGGCARVIKEAVKNREALAAAGEAACREIYVSWEEAAQKAYLRYEQIVAARRNKKLWKG